MEAVASRPKAGLCISHQDNEMESKWHAGQCSA